MNTRLVVSIASAVIAVGLVLFAIRAWNSWPSIGRYRIRRNEAATKSTVQKYLEGKISLDSTAIEVGRLMRQRMYLGWADDPNENGMTSVNATLTLQDTRPRIPGSTSFPGRASSSSWGVARHLTALWSIIGDG